MEDSKKNKVSVALELSVFTIKANVPEIRSMVECPICYNIILSPITVCSSGHSVCNYCKTRLQSCPTCRGEFTTIRNLFAENFLDKCLLTCRGRDKGCNVVLSGKELSVHQNETCEFRPLLCRQCFTNIPYDMYLDHLRATEKIKFKDDNSFSAGFAISDRQFLSFRDQNSWMSVWDPIWIHCYENDFFCLLDQSSIQVEQPYWFIWVAAMGTVEDCKKFKCSITIWNKKAKPGTKPELKYVGPIHPIRSQAQTDQVLESGKCLIFLDQNLKTFMYEGGIDVKFSVHYTKNDQDDQGTSTQSG